MRVWDRFDRNYKKCHVSSTYNLIHEHGQLLHNLRTKQYPQKINEEVFPFQIVL